MRSREHPGDEANSSFGSAEPKLLESRPGVEPATPRDTDGPDEYPQAPSTNGHLDRTPLAQRVREGKGD